MRFCDFIPTEEEIGRFDAFIVDYIKPGKSLVPVDNKKYVLDV